MIKAQFMSMWDGIITDPHCRIMIVAATNRPGDIDPAILRRLPCQFNIRKPVGKTYEISFHVQNIPWTKNVFVDFCSFKCCFCVHIFQMYEIHCCLSKRGHVLVSKTWTFFLQEKVQRNNILRLVLFPEDTEVCLSLPGNHSSTYSLQTPVLILDIIRWYRCSHFYF